MLGFNWIDLIILLVLVLAIYEGIRIGLSVQLFIVIGFFGGLFLGGWLFPHLLPIHDRTLLTLVNGNLVLVLAVILAIVGFELGLHFRYLLGEGKLYQVESKAGVIVSISAVLLLAWLAGAAVGRLPFSGLSNSTNDAKIIRTLNDNLPAIPAVFAVFNKQVDPNATPLVAQNKPDPLKPLISTIEFKLADDKAKASTVKLTSFGCGGIVSGSGFVVAPGLVVTNAHVIAGVKKPVIKYNNRSYTGKPVLFNPSIDYALVSVPDLKANSLTLEPNEVPNGTTVAVLGYPNGNFRLNGGIIHGNFVSNGKNIYDLGDIEREVYEIRTNVDNGSSGGPVINSSGKAIGIMFAKSDVNDVYAYAITANSLVKDINRSVDTNAAVGTGACLAR